MMGLHSPQPRGFLSGPIRATVGTVEDRPSRSNSTVSESRWTRIEWGETLEKVRCSLLAYKLGPEGELFFLGHFSSLLGSTQFLSNQFQMHFNRILLLAAASFAVAAPEPRPDPVAMPAPQTTGLLSELPGLLTGAEDLLSQTNINNLQIIIGNAAKLLSDSNLEVLQDILTNAHSLLTKEFVDNTTTLIGDATPVGILFRSDYNRDNRLTRDLARGGCVKAAGWSAGNLVEGDEFYDFHGFNDSIRDQSWDYYYIYIYNYGTFTEPSIGAQSVSSWHGYIHGCKRKEKKRKERPINLEPKEKQRKENERKQKKQSPQQLNHIQFVTQTLLIVA